MATTSRDPATVKAKIGQALQAGDQRKALALGERLFKLPKSSPADCMSVAELAESLGDVDLAVLALRQAHRRSPEDVQVLFRLAETEHRAGQTVEALDHLEKARALATQAVELDYLANLLNRMGDAAAAARAFDDALALEPNNLSILANRAIAKAFMGQAEDAEAIYDDIIGWGHNSALTYLNRSWLRKQTAEANHLDDLKAALARVGENTAESAFLNYAIAKECEDLGRFDEAFTYLQTGAAQRRANIVYDLNVDLAEFDALKKAFDASFLSRGHKGHPSEEPIFILGLPRTGSTLVERILGAHSQVFAAGELQSLRLQMRRKATDVAHRQGLYQNFDMIRMCRDIDFKGLGRDYIRSTRPHAGQVPHFIDKLPTNFVYIGLIAAALPNAKIIHTCRNPMDTCYAILKQPFLESYYYSYDQKELGGYFVGYKALMDHWAAALPGRIIDVHYEDMVADSEAVAKDLVARLGLEWEDACLDHTANREASTTASALQVRQPIYKTSVDKWRRFEKQLEPLRDTLRAGGLEIE